MFEYILLEPDQKDLLIKLVESARNAPRKQPFMFVQTLGGAFIHHPGFGENAINAYKGDIEALGRVGLVALQYHPKGSLSFDITPSGFKYYEYLQQQIEQPVQRVETSIRRLLDSESFQRKYPIAYRKWVEAETILWSTDSEQQLTTIGHLCREAIQEFATVLVDQYQPLDVNNDKAKTKARVKAVLEVSKLGTTTKPLMEALLHFWETNSDLIQRQEHGGQKEGRPLIWEDGRRVVFLTAVVMFEIDRALSLPS